MKNKFLAVTLLLLISLSTKAALIESYNESIDVLGQRDSITTTLSGNFYTDVTFDFDIFGDFGTLSTETIEFFIDGVSLGAFTYNTAGITSKLLGNSLFDYNLIGSIAISQLDWDRFVSDGKAIFGYANSSNVGTGFNDAHYVSFAVNGTLVNRTSFPLLNQISAPGSLLLVIIGAVTLLVRRKS